MFMNPLVGTYPAKDGFIMLTMLAGPRLLGRLCAHIDRPDLVSIRASPPPIRSMATRRT